MFTLTSSVSIDNTQISILYNSVDTLVVQECGSFYQVCLGLFFFFDVEKFWIHSSKEVRQNFSYWLILMTICLHLSDSNIDSCFFQTEPQNVRCQKQRNLCLVFLDIKIWLHFRCIFLLFTSQGKRKPWPPSQKDQLWSNQL